MTPPTLSRRVLLATGLAAAATPLAGHPGTRFPGGGHVRAALMNDALAALARHRDRFAALDHFAVVDFAAPSPEPRLHLVDVSRGHTRSVLVAHGKGSDPAHSGRAQRFSNVGGSLASSLGTFVTGESYLGVHGFSRRLIGLDPTNDAAFDRAIVIHAAWYAEPALVATQGKLGRSDGCFAVPQGALATIVLALRPGRMLYAGA